MVTYCLLLIQNSVLASLYSSEGSVMEVRIIEVSCDC